LATVDFAVLDKMATALKVAKVEETADETATEEETADELDMSYLEYDEATAPAKKLSSNNKAAPQSKQTNYSGRAGGKPATRTGRAPTPPDIFNFDDANNLTEN
jgi:hypothetical protein